jgi:transglutaminase-like putative cysteine protease
MRIDRLRFFWPALCVLLTLALVGSTIYGRVRLRAARRPRPAVKAERFFDKREQAHLEKLAAFLDYSMPQPPKPSDAARLAAYLCIEWNKERALAGGTQIPTFPTRDLSFSQRATFPLAPTIQAMLPAAFTQFRYELVNKSARDQPAPILFQKDRWDTVTDLVASAGFLSIPDEIDRAAAIWRYVCARRVFGEPVTEGDEEHDVIKFLALYGYGFCDDSARAVATLAEQSGLRARVWELHGHVVAEIFANGHWRMFDADQQAYFHQADAPRDILGVEELAADRQAFSHMVSARGGSVYLEKFLNCFLTRQDNEIVRGGTVEHRIRPILRGGERMVFTNYNWGRYFLGKYPTRPPRFLNGFFQYVLRATDLTAERGLVIEPTESGCRLSNSGAHLATAELLLRSDLPIVGGSIHGEATMTKGRAKARITDSENACKAEVELSGDWHFDLDHFVGVLTHAPTYASTLAFILEPGAVLELRNVTIIRDFQFAPLALLALQPGANEIHAYFPEGCDPAVFEIVVVTK